MSKKRKAGGFRRKKSTRPPTSNTGVGFGGCGCSHLVVRAADGVCEDCGRADSMTFPPMPSAQHVGDVADVGWSCSECGGEVVGRGVVTKVLADA